MSSHLKIRSSKNNGRKSHGPSTPQGRQRSDQARLSHGLTAKARCLPSENRDEAAQEALKWHDDVNPQGPRQHHVLDQLLEAVRQVQRCQRYSTATVSGQIHTALTHLRQQMEAEVARLVALFTRNPHEAVTGLRASSLGCQWLIKQWELVRQALLDFGFFTRHHLWLMLRLSGAAPVLKPKVGLVDFFGLNVEKFHIEFHALYCRPTPPRPNEIETVFQTTFPGMEEAYRQKWPTREAHQTELLRRIEEALAELRAREEELRTGPEVAEKELAADQALLIEDPVKARLTGRYASDGHSLFFRACRELRLLRKEAREDAEAEDENEDEVEDEAVETEAPDAPEAASEADLPNDPKVQGLESQDFDSQGTCDTNLGEYSETGRNSYWERLAAGPYAGLLKPSARPSPG
jgi:hypothetical protein